MINWYWCNCDNNIVQYYGKQINPRCPLCNRIMTIGKYLNIQPRYEEDFILKKIN